MSVAPGWEIRGSGRASGPAAVVGASGMLGRAVCGLLGASSTPYYAPGRAALDLARTGFANAALRSPPEPLPSVIINCAGWTDVDGAEEHEAEATRVNGEAIAELARLAAAWDAVLVNYGTDYVFDGSGTSPYPVDAPRRPINAYGRSKAAGEEALENAACEWLHIRTSWLYAPWGKNFVRTIARAGRERPVLRVVDDQRGRPTSAEHLARTTMCLLAETARGVWHATDDGECTWFGFAREIVRLTGGTAAVEPCTSAEFPRPAKRPAYSVLDIKRTNDLLGPPCPDWRRNLADVAGRLEL